MTTTNKGILTEYRHYQLLVDAFGNESVTDPKGSGNGSDFRVHYDDQVISFESKTSNTDIFDAGFVNVFANGAIYGASSFLTNTHITQIQAMLFEEQDQLLQYTEAAGTDRIPHTIERDRFDQIKADKKLIHIMSEDPLNNIIEESFLKTSNMFVKANYIVIDNSVYLVSEKPELDPLQLGYYGAPVLNDACIDKVTIRSARRGTKGSLRVGVNMRVQFRLHRILPESRVKLI